MSKMQITYFEKEYFSPADSLKCGQVFRFFPASTVEGEGYFLLSGDKACFLTEKDGRILIFSEEKDKEYFYNYFDLSFDYARIVREAKNFSCPYLASSAEYAKGIRIFRQDTAECILSFILAQQNNIPRIKKMLLTLSEKYGEKKEFLHTIYYTFPSLAVLASLKEEDLRTIGFGYRAPYFLAAAKRLSLNPNQLETFAGETLKKQLLSFCGIGEKVADCISLFAFHDTSAFPVDVWIEKIYREDFLGKEKDRKKINAYFTKTFGTNGGIYQQYLFFYKRETEKSERIKVKK